MLTVIKPPAIIVPGSEYSEDTGFKGHAFFEASSIRKADGKYYFIYSSEVMHELCYAISEKPDKDFVYAGVLVSNCDIGISTYKPSDKVMAYGGNNHGSIIEINGNGMFSTTARLMVHGIAGRDVPSILKRTAMACSDRQKLLHVV